MERPSLGAVMPEFRGVDTGKETPCCAEHNSCRRPGLRDSLQAVTCPEPSQSAEGIQQILPFIPQQRKIFS